MFSTSTIIIVAILVVGFGYFVAWQPGTRNKTLESLPRVLRALIAGMENGAAVRVRHRGSDGELNYVRLSGEESKAIVELLIQQGCLSKSSVASLVRSLETQGFECSLEDRLAGKLIRVTIPISDIWSSSSIAPPAQAARIYCEALGIPKSAKFDMRVSGRTSRRIMNASDHV